MIQHLVPTEPYERLTIVPGRADGLAGVPGYDTAIVGTATHEGHRVLVYDRDECVILLAKMDEISLEDAEDYFGFNIEGGSKGPGAPAFVEFACRSCGMLKRYCDCDVASPRPA